MNAIAHGVTALSVPPAEQPAYRAHRQGLAEAYQPANAVEEFLVDRIAMLMWRLRRLDAWEAFQLEKMRRESLARASYHETEEPSSLDRAMLQDPERRYAHVRPEVMTLEQARVEIERLTGDSAWQYLRDEGSIAELDAMSRDRLAYHEATKDLSAPPTLDELEARCPGGELDNELLGVVFDLYDSLTGRGIEPAVMARAVLGRKPTADETEAIADPTGWNWEPCELVRLWQLVDKVSESDGGPDAHNIIHQSVCRKLVEAARLQGIAARVRLLFADAERVGLVLSNESETKHHRYDANLERSLFRAMHELEALQEKRRGGAAPLARVEVHGTERGA